MCQSFLCLPTKTGPQNVPITGPDGAGSRISLAALRLLNVGLAGLHELDVFRS